MSSLHMLMERIQYLQKEIQTCLEKIRKAPEGRLVVRNMPGNIPKYTRKIRLPNGPVKEEYLRKENIPIAQALAQKALAENRLQDYTEELHLLEKLAALRSKPSRADHFLTTHPAWHPLLDTVSINKELEDWKNAPYLRNQNYPQQLIYPTVVPGLKVRSKSEADIVAAFEKHHVPYHYDEILDFHGERLSMDFICRNLSSGQYFYWDHRGMSDNPAYVQKVLYCDNLFFQTGIIPWKNLIITTETKDMPLDLQWVDLVIQYYLL